MYKKRQGCRVNGALLHCWWEYKMVQSLWETVVNTHSKKLQSHSQESFAIFCLGCDSSFVVPLGLLLGDAMFVLLSFTFCSIPPKLLGFLFALFFFCSPHVLWFQRCRLQGCPWRSSFKLYSTLSVMSLLMQNVSYCSCVYYLSSTIPKVWDPYR